MFKTKKATIGKVQIKLEGGLHRLDFGTSEPIPLIDKIDYNEYLNPLTLRMDIIASGKRKYEPMEWTLVGDADPFVDYIQLCNLAELLKGNDWEFSKPEDLKGEKVTIIVDGDNDSRANIVFAIGKDGKYVIPHWIVCASKCEQEKAFYSEKEAKEVLERIVPIALGER